jgi:hypothetical protein
MFFVSSCNKKETIKPKVKIDSSSNAHYYAISTEFTRSRKSSRTSEVIATVKDGKLIEYWYSLTEDDNHVMEKPLEIKKNKANYFFDSFTEYEFLIVDKFPEENFILKKREKINYSNNDSSNDNSITNNNNSTTTNNSTTADDPNKCSMCGYKGYVYNNHLCPTCDSKVRNTCPTCHKYKSGCNGLECEACRAIKCPICGDKKGNKYKKYCNKCEKKYK